MTDASIQVPQNPIVRALNSMFDAMIALSESSKISRRLRAVAEMSDTELRAKGLTRQDAVRRVIADLHHV